MQKGIPRSARVGPGILSFDCMVSGIPNPHGKVSGIANLDLSFQESYQKSGIPVSIPEVVQHCYSEISTERSKGSPKSPKG